MWPDDLQPTTPGLFVTGTDTSVGKTVVACAIAYHLRGLNGITRRVGVCKPIATGCRMEREGLVSSDAEALAHFADCRLPLEVINPVRYHAPLAPAVAAEQCGRPVNLEDVGKSLRMLDADSDVLVLEGIGGLLVPIDAAAPNQTVLDMIRILDYPVVVVTRPDLGTLNHTAMTVTLLCQAGCRVAGLVINRLEADTALCPDPSVSSNGQWMQQMTGQRILATIPKCATAEITPAAGHLSPAVLETTAHTDWVSLAAIPRQH